MLFAVVFFLKSLDYAYRGAFGPGPGFFPSWLSGILIVFSIVLIAQQFAGTGSRREAKAKASSGNAAYYKEIVYVLAGMVVYIAVLPFLGFIVASALFLAALFLRGVKWYVNIIVSIGVSTGLFLIFDTLLGVALPTNQWGW